MTKLKKIIFGGKWYTAYRSFNSDTVFNICYSPANEYCADPFLISDNNKTYIFCEQYRMDRRKGCIGYYEFVDGVPVNKGIIIERPYHMSYPCVFKYNDEYYMIPETGENKTVEVYKADEFPYKWTLYKVLLSGKAYVDTTVIISNNCPVMVTYCSDQDGYSLEKYEISKDFSSVRLTCKKRYPENTGRGAGAFFTRSDGSLIRPSQNCRSAYGENVIFNKVTELHNNYDEVPIGMLTINDVKFDKIIRRKNIMGLHTYTFNNNYEVIDIFVRQFSLTYTIGNLMAKKKRIKHIMGER